MYLPFTTSPQSVLPQEDGGRNRNGLSEQFTSEDLGAGLKELSPTRSPTDHWTILPVDLQSFFLVESETTICLIPRPPDTVKETELVQTHKNCHTEGVNGRHPYTHTYCVSTSPSLCFSFIYVFGSEHETLQKRPGGIRWRIKERLVNLESTTFPTKFQQFLFSHKLI